MKLTDWLAVYAALVSTAALAWNIYQTRPRLRISFAYTVDGDSVGAVIAIQNHSSHAIHVASLNFVYQYRRPSVWERVAHVARFRTSPMRVGMAHAAFSLYEVASGCPVTIEPRKSHRVTVPGEVAKKLSAQSKDGAFAVCVQDDLWNSTYSRPFKVEL